MSVSLAAATTGTGQFLGKFALACSTVVNSGVNPASEEFVRKVFIPAMHYQHPDTAVGYSDRELAKLTTGALVHGGLNNNRCVLVINTIRRNTNPPAKVVLPVGFPFALQKDPNTGRCPTTLLPTHPQYDAVHQELGKLFRTPNRFPETQDFFASPTGNLFTLRGRIAGKTGVNPFKTSIGVVRLPDTPPCATNGSGRDVCVERLEDHPEH